MEWKKIIVAYIFICVRKCLAMSRNELEDFVEFIQKTSHLDEPLILKKGTRPNDESDEDDPVSDHAWEESGKFEGDLILNERQRRLIIQDVTEGLARNGLTDTTKRWPNNEVIYYIQKEHFSSDQVQAIQDGIDDLARASCIKFRPYRKGDRDAVVVQGSRRGCFSQVGYQGGYQVLNLSGRHPVGRGCFRHGTVVHEFLHTLGFFHMQSSSDRDDYIDVLWQNIIQPARHNFRKYNSFSVSDFGVGYDYDSVLHYSRKAFSSNGGDTLVPKQDGASIGQRVGLSDKDVKKLNKMYCDVESDSHDESNADLKPPKTISNKKSKNKPFTGHGIGYHQGKTVVIKLPAADTYKLSDLPTFHMFDYFSKTPQSMSPATITEGLGTGKEINYNYDPPEIEQYKRLYDREGYQNIAQNKKDYEKLKNTNNQSRHNEEPAKKTTSGKNQSSSREDYDINEAFERLGKIILSQVYPSQQNHYDHRGSDYSLFFRPIKEKSPEPEIQKVDDAYRATPPLNKNNEYLSKKFIKELSDFERPKEIRHEYKENLPAPIFITDKIKEIDSTYGMEFPFKEMKAINDEYSSIEKLRHMHKYPSYKSVVEDASNSPFTRTHATSNFVMQDNETYEKQENIKVDNDKYKVQEYTHHPLQDRAFSLRPKPQGFKLQLKSYLRNIHLPPVGKSAYKLFGVIIPITQNWYKIDYDTLLGEDHG